MVKSLKTNTDSTENPLYQKREKNYRIGGNLHKNKNLYRYVRWPEYILFQRKRRELIRRLKVPPILNPFYDVLPRNYSYSLFRLLSKYRPESRSSKNERLKSISNKSKAEIDTLNLQDENKKPIYLKFGLKHVTQLVEKNLAKLVVIACDVDPIELVLWLPSLCDSFSIPYCVVKNKSQLGKLVHQKTCSAICLTSVYPKDLNDFTTLTQICLSNFSQNDYLKRNRYSELGTKSFKRHQEAYRKRMSKYNFNF